MNYEDEYDDTEVFNEAEEAELAADTNPAKGL
jgi:hypothetical protein